MLTHAHLVNQSPAFIGVDVFFVLSGFLITSLLLEEWRDCADIKLRAFYYRRALRLLPALIVMLGVVVLFLFIISRPAAVLAAKDALAALFYVSNWWQFFDPFRGSFFKHTWSLSIEEQFYMVWPPLLILCLKRSRSVGSLLRFLVLAIVVVVFWRMLAYAWWAREMRTARGTDTRADALLIGALAGTLFISGAAAEERIKRFLRVAAIVSVVLLCLIGARGWGGYRLVYLIYPAVSVFAAITIFTVACYPAGWLVWSLSRRPLVQVGKISYGLYVWHFPIFAYIEGEPLSRSTKALWQFSICAIVSILSFFLLEKPFLRLKNKFARVH